MKLLLFNLFSDATKEQTINFNECRYHRVLARQDNLYFPGILRSVIPGNTVLVEFDHPKGSCQIYGDLLGYGQFDVIKNTSPSFSDVKSDDLVVCASDPEEINTSFIVSKIIDVLNDRKMFVLRAIDSGVVTTVHRAQIRLLQPPWCDELLHISLDIPSPQMDSPTLLSMIPCKSTTITASQDHIDQDTSNISNIMAKIRLPVPKMKIKKKKLVDPINDVSLLTEQKKNSPEKTQLERCLERTQLNYWENGYAHDAMGGYKILNRRRYPNKSQKRNRETQDIKIVFEENLSVHHETHNIEMDNEIFIKQRTLTVRESERRSYLPENDEPLYHKASTDVMEIQSVDIVQLPGNLTAYLDHMRH